MNSVSFKWCLVILKVNKAGAENKATQKLLFFNTDVFILRTQRYPQCGDNKRVKG